MAKFLRLDSVSKVQLYAPEYLLVELDRHESKLVGLTAFGASEIDVVREDILANIQIVPDEEIPFEEFVVAMRMLRDIDVDDVAFVALTNHLDGYLLTGDKALINGLQKKGYTRVLSFGDLLEQE